MPALRSIRQRVREASDLGLGVAIFLPLLILYVATANVSQESASADPVSAALAGWQWVNHHNFYFDGQIRPNLWIFLGKGGHLVTNRSPGVILFGLPFYALLGRSPVFSLFPAAVAGATAAAGAVAFLVLALRRELGNRVALATGVVLAFGTATWSVSSDSLWTHGPDQLALAAAMYLLSRNRHILAGICIGLSCTSRPHLAAVALVLGVWFAVRRRSVKPLLTYGIPSCAGIAAIALWNHWLLGVWSIQATRTYTNAGLTSLAGGSGYNLGTNILGTFVSPNRGLLVWFPLLLVLCVGLRRAWRDAPDWARACAVGGLVYLMLQLKVNYFSGGTNFWSYRFAIESVTLAAPLLAYAGKHLWKAGSVWRRLIIATAAYSIGAQAVGALFFNTRIEVLIDPWTHFGLATELLHDGSGPRVVMGITTAVVVAALVWPRRSPRSVQVVTE